MKPNAVQNRKASRPPLSARGSALPLRLPYRHGMGLDRDRSPRTGSGLQFEKIPGENEPGFDRKENI